MGGAVGNAALEPSVDYKKIPNNTNSKWWLDPCLRWNVFHCVGLCGTLFFNGYDGSLFTGLQTLDYWETYFDHPAGNTLGLMNSAALFPGLISPIFAEIIARRFGRRYAVWTGTIINTIGAVINASSVNQGMYIAGRVLMGIGISMALTIAPTLLQEFAHPRYRAPLGSVYTCIYYIAAVISAAIVLGTRHVSGNASWRIPCYLQLVGPIFTFACTITMPESPRWLMKHDNREAALGVLADYHANGDRQDPLVMLQFNEITQSLDLEVQNSQTSYLDLVKSGNRHRLFILVAVAIGTNWVGNGIISYYLSPILNSIGVTSTGQQAGLNLGLQIWNLIISTTAGLNCDRVGRRPLYLAATIGMLCSFIVVMGLSASYAENGSHTVGIAVIPFLFIFFGFYDVAWTPLSNMYTVEVLPYNLRAKGQAVYNIVQGSANAVNQWVNPIILDAIKWKYYSVYIAILSLYVVIIWYGFPETKGLTIEEIALIFDKDKAAALQSASGTAVKSSGEFGNGTQVSDLDAKTEHTYVVSVA